MRYAQQVFIYHHYQSTSSKIVESSAPVVAFLHAAWLIEDVVRTAISRRFAGEIVAALQKIARRRSCVKRLVLLSSSIQLSFLTLLPVPYSIERIFANLISRNVYRRPKVFKEPSSTTALCPKWSALVSSNRNTACSQATVLTRISIYIQTYFSS